MFHDSTLENILQDSYRICLIVITLNFNRSNFSNQNDDYAKYVKFVRKIVTYQNLGVRFDKTDIQRIKLNFRKFLLKCTRQR